jgi:hypothetical protein
MQDIQRKIKHWVDNKHMAMRCGPSHLTQHNPGFLLASLPEHNTLYRYIYLMELTNSSLWRRCCREKETSVHILCEYLGIFFLDPVLGVKVWGISGTYVKERGSLELVSDYGVKQACFKAEVHWDIKGLNPTTNLI